ncbi:hypothetical protein [Aerosakkonema funiforme]|uniref:hypothetical protein n=1 Tax=Aerosakkonema funiforme TaxID=1246630 RepID=UPI0035B9AC2A
MDLEIVFNELSLLTPAADIPTARKLMSDFINTVRTATTQGVKRVIRTQSDLNNMLLAPSYPLSRWRNDNEVQLEERSFFRTLITKEFLIDITDPDIENSINLSDFKHQGEQASGLGHAFLLDALAMSVKSEPRWDCSRLELEVTRLDDNEHIVDEVVEVIHASSSNHIHENHVWIKNRIRTKIIDGLDLWNQKKELFPSLEFCEDVEKQMPSLASGNPTLQQIIKRLSELEDYCKSWKSGAFNYDNLPCKVSPESETRLQQFEQELTIKCPDGVKRVFSLHVRMTPGAWRLHFSVELGPGKIIIGYIGPKIQ